MKSSFKQAGKTVLGKLCKGTAAKTRNRLAQHSFLSKNEKKEGFGSSVERFQNLSKKFPGPGSYLTPGVENPSVSKKGFGGLTNSAPRFKVSQYLTSNPGPGAYEMNENNVVKGFKFPLGCSKSSDRVQLIPAPGEYDPDYYSSTKEMTSVFKSTSERLQKYGKDCPAPGQYTPNYELVKKSAKGLTSVFKTSTNSVRYEVLKQDTSIRTLRNLTPGPGEYNVESVITDRSGSNDESFRTEPNRLSSMFAPSQKDRFGISILPKKLQQTPAPGDYEPQYREKTTFKSGAISLCKSERGLLKNNNGNPGPSFYKPMIVPKKKSFHSRPNKQWV